MGTFNVNVNEIVEGADTIGVIISRELCCTEDGLDERIAVDACMDVALIAVERARLTAIVLSFQLATCSVTLVVTPEET